MRYEVRVADRTMRVEVDGAERFLVDGAAVAAEIDETARGLQWRIRIDGEQHEATVLTREPFRIQVDGVEVDASAIDERALAASRGTRQRTAGRHELRAPMPGLLKVVHVREGDRVEADAPLLTLEAMKMENEIRAPSPGTITMVAAQAGTKVEGGAVLLILTEDA